MVATRRKRASAGAAASNDQRTTAVGSLKSRESPHKRQALEDTQPAFPAGAIYKHGRAVTVCNDAETVNGWIKSQVHVGGTDLVPVGFDCEWSPPWHRGDGAEEKVGVIQLATASACLVVQVQAMDSLPAGLAALLADANCLKIGVNVRGDLNRLVRDFGVSYAGAHDLAELAHGIRDGPKPRSLEDLAKSVLRVQMGSKTGGPRMSDWAKWPLDDAQVQYAAGDAAIAHDIFAKGNKALRAHDPGRGCSTSDAGEQPGKEAQEKGQTDKESGAPKHLKAGAKSNFFQMMRNRSIEPPLRGKKSYPRGEKDILEDYCFIVSGVLDSMDRAQCSEFIRRHGGKVATTFSKQVTHVLNDHGEIGPSKLKKAKAGNVPIVGEDFLLRLVDPSWAPPH